MLISIYAVKDVKAAIFKNHFPEIEMTNAIRNFHVAVRDQNSQLGQFPQDFELYQIAEFDNVQGKFQNLENPKFMTSGMLCKKLDEQIDRMNFKKEEKNVSSDSKPV